MGHHTLLAGCGRYLQGEGILSSLGSELISMHLKRPFIIGGVTAMEKSFCPMKSSLETENIAYVRRLFHGHCTDRAVAGLCGEARALGCDCILGVGGGTVLDTAKAVAVKLDVPILCIPTCASTCAAATALSVMYSDEGKQIRIDFFNREVDVVVADTSVLAAAPPRLLAAGIADSFAKLCEYSSPKVSLAYGEKSIGLYSGYVLSGAVNEALLSAGAKAYRDALAGRATKELEDCIFVIISLVGVVSGLGGYGGRGGARFAIAHAVNEVMRIDFPETAESWLHGELVGLGVLAQLQADGYPDDYIQKCRSLLREIRVPVSFRELGFPGGKEAAGRLVSRVLECTSLEGAQRQDGEQALQSLFE